MLRNFELYSFYRQPEHCQKLIRNVLASLSKVKCCIVYAHFKNNISPRILIIGGKVPNFSSNKPTTQNWWTAKVSYFMIMNTHLFKVIKNYCNYFRICYLIYSIRPTQPHLNFNFFFGLYKIVWMATTLKNEETIKWHLCRVVIII